MVSVGSTRKLSLCVSELSKSGRRCWAQTILMLLSNSIISRCFAKTKGNMMRYGLITAKLGFFIFLRSPQPTYPPSVLSDKLNYITYDKFQCEIISVKSCPTENLLHRKFVTSKIFNDLISLDFRWIVEISPKFIPPKYYHRNLWYRN